MPLFSTHNPEEGIFPNQLMLFTTATRVPLPPGMAGSSTVLTYEILSNSRPDLCSVQVDGAELVVDAIAGVGPGEAVVAVRATDSVGNTETGQLKIQILESYAAWRTRVFSPEDAVDDAVSGPTVKGDGRLTHLERFLFGYLPGEDPPAHPVTHQSVENKVRFTLPLATSVHDYRIRIERSDNLQIWNDVEYTMISSVAEFGREIRTIEVNALPSAPSFFRVAMELTPPP